MNTRDKIQVLFSWLDDFPVPNQAKQIKEFINEQQGEINKLVVENDKLIQQREEADREAFEAGYNEGVFSIEYSNEEIEKAFQDYKSNQG